MPLINGERLAAVAGPMFATGGPREANDGLDPKDAFLPSLHYLTPSARSFPTLKDSGRRHGPPAMLMRKLGMQLRRRDN